MSAFSTRHRVLLALALVFLLGAAWCLLRESEEERLAEWIGRVAQSFPQRETAAYLELVDLEHYGLRLERYAVHDHFGSSDGEPFLAVVESARPMLAGSDIVLRRVKTRINGDLARVEAVAHWKRSQATTPGPTQARMRVEARLVRQGEGWVFSSLRVAPLLAHPRGRDW